jgi:hypothetical protein
MPATTTKIAELNEALQEEINLLESLIDPIDSLNANPQLRKMVLKYRKTMTANIALMDWIKTEDKQLNQIFR